MSQKWRLLENIGKQKGVYDNLLTKYELDSVPDNVDAILFVDYKLEPRLWGLFVKETKIQEITVDNLRPMYAGSKLWLYDVRTKTRLFHKTVQKGYSEFSKQTIDDAFDALFDLSDIPPVSRGP